MSVHGHTLSLLLQDVTGAKLQNVWIGHAVIAGWTGRDPEVLEKHIAELAALGVRRPSSTPIFYRISAARVTKS